jgi:hypothetical protein
MKVFNQYNSPMFNSRCPEIKLGQDICHKVNCDFPHYSLYKFRAMIDKGISRRIVKPKAIMDIISKHNDINADNYTNPVSYFPSLFDSIKKYHYFNCHESALLAELILKINGIKNSYTACLRDGKAKGNHILCLFNRDGSKIAIREENGELIPQIENNKTIIIDPWAGICDFANNALKEYHSFWDKCLKPNVMADRADGKYNLIKACSMDLPEEFLDTVKKNCPNLQL